MKPSPFRILAAVALLALGTVRPAAAADRDELEATAARTRVGPKSAPVQNDTSFSAGLKCMDNLFRTYGIHNVTVVIDEIPDATKKVNVGARDMFMSATSQMSRASHAIRLVALPDSKLISDSERKKRVSESDFVVQGSISQFDDSMLQKQRDGAVCLWYLCIGAADSDTFSGLGLDLNLVETAGMTIVPNANVRNAVLIRKHGRGFDGDLTLKKFSAQYNFTLVSSDGNGQALRTLIDLGSIEMYGRLLKLPYWSCLGVGEDDPEVKSEINDWWEELAGDDHDHRRLLAYLQIQMRAQGLYTGDVNGRPDPALLRAVRAYRMALGEPDDLNLNAAFLRQYLQADHFEVRKVAADRMNQIAEREGPLPAPPVAAAPAPDAPQAAATPVPPVAGPSASTPPMKPGPAVAAAPAGVAAPLPATAAATIPAAAAKPVAAGPAPAPAVAAAPAAAAHTVAQSPEAAPPPAAALPAVYRPATAEPVISTIRIEGTRPANNHAYKPGEAFFVGVKPQRGGYLYCYTIDDAQHASQFYPAATHTAARVGGNAVQVLPGEGGLPLVAGHPGHRQEVACFSSAKDLGRAPADAATLRGGIEALRTRFAAASGGNYEQGVFNVKVQ